MLAIAIISLIGFVFSMIKIAAEEEKFDANSFLAIIAIISWWNICFPLSIIILILSCIMFIKELNDWNS